MRQQAIGERGRVEIGEQHHQAAPPGQRQDRAGHRAAVGFDELGLQRGHGVDKRSLRVGRCRERFGPKCTRFVPDFFACFCIALWYPGQAIEE